jgi:hypothetical protein
MGRQLENFGFCTNATIDFLAVGALLDNLIDAARVTKSEELAMWQDMKTKLPPFGVTDGGLMREYTNSAFIDRQNNLGTMHAYGLWPLKNISFNDRVVSFQPPVAAGAAAREQQTTLRAASFNAVMARLDQGSTRQDARSIAIAAVQCAHGGVAMAANAVRDCLAKLVQGCYSGSGLCVDTDWRGSGLTKPGAGEFDSVGNLGFTNAITECLLQSNRNTLRILPVIFDGLQCGKITDAATDFAARVSIDWDIKKGRCAVKIMPKTDCRINIEINREFSKLRDKSVKLQSDINGLRDVDLRAGKTVTFEFV